MMIVADASVLVAELVRPRGRALVRDSRLEIIMTQAKLSETWHEFNRRLRRIVASGRIGLNEVTSIRIETARIFDANAIRAVQDDDYRHLEPIARCRIPRDPNDWPTVALAIATGADILTHDHDFLGCGCATWTFETLRDELADGDWRR